VKTVCGSDEPHPYPVRSFTYHTEQTRADEVQEGDHVQYIVQRANPYPCTDSEAT
jgi:hypothetical protein